jgi:heme oxygenase
VQTATIESLSVLLREQTRPDHERAERSDFLAALLAGKLSTDIYADLLAQLLPVYAALEMAAPRLAQDPRTAPFVREALFRVPAIEADLTHLIGPDWSSRVEVTNAAVAYAQRVDEVAQSWPAGWIAHHYTRYLGDLAGGQAIRAILQRHYGLGALGTSFFDFAALGPIKPFRDDYRAALDACPLDAEHQQRVVEEASRAFRHNRAIFDELGERHVIADTTNQQPHG